MAFPLHLLLLCLSATSLRVATAFVCPSRCVCALPSPHTLVINATGSGVRFPPKQRYLNITTLYVSVIGGDLGTGDLGTNDLDLRDLLCPFPEVEQLYMSLGSWELKGGNFSKDCAPSLRVIHVRNAYLSTEQLQPLIKLNHLAELSLVENTMELSNDTMLEGSWDQLQSLEISHNTLEIPSLGSLLFVNATRITHLSMQGNGITTLPTDILAPLSVLSLLNLADNAISELGFLATASDTITGINLRSNGIKEIVGSTFRHMNKLKSLDLGGNAIKKIDGVIFPCCSQLQHLHLDHNDIATISPYIFGHLNTLISLNLSHNDIETLHTDMFLTLNDSLCDLNANCNVEPEDDRPWRHFQSLDVSFNRITHVEMELVTHKLALIEFLDLSHNTLHNLPRLEQLPRLQTVNLSHNHLTWLDVGVFNNPKLSIIDLSYNQITKIISMAFLYLPALSYLDLSHNKINYIYKMAFYRTCKHGQAMTVDLSTNGLHNDVLLKLVDCFKHLQDTPCTVSIDLQHNAISRLLQQPSVSMHLLLQQNKDANFFNSWDHVRFSIQHNQISCDCKLVSDINVFEEMRTRYGETFVNPQFLSFWRNASCSSPNKLNGVPVEDFYSKMHSRCHEEYICPRACDCVPHSTYTFINCSYRNLKQPPVLLLPGPKILQLQGNHFNELHDLQFQQVQSINFSDCGIQSITANAWSALTEIPSVFLQNNAIASLPVESQCISELNLLNNPLHCGCSNANMLRWLHTCNDTLKDFAQMNCSNGTSLLESSYQNCLESHVHFKAGYITLLSLCVTFLVGLLILTLTYQHRGSIGNYLMGAKKWHKVQAEEYDEYDIVVILSQSDGDFVKTEILPILQKYNCKGLQLQNWKDEPYEFANVVQSSSICMLVTSSNFMEDMESEVGYRGCIHSLLDSSVPMVCLVSVDGTTLPYKYPPHQQISYNTDDFRDKLLGVVERSVPV